MFGRGKMESRIEALEMETEQQGNELSRLREQVYTLQNEVRGLHVALNRLSPPVLSAGNPYHPSVN